MTKLKMFAVAALSVTAVAFTSNQAEAKAGCKKPAVKRGVRRAPVYRYPRGVYRPFPIPYPDSGYGQHRMPHYGRGTCGNSGWPCGPNNGGGDPGGSGGGGG